ncbi:MAG TPA: aminomethyl transferase family protein, partial [Thermoplasmata archaeon]|nr:aminomethyl transferase family protein [Thermoplasmata archaeon]
MRRGSPFHSRTSALCESWEWRGWAGYLAASSYSLVPEMEYYAIRHSAGLLDVSPLYKYLINGKDALHLVNKVVTRDASKLAKGQIYYTPWCDERGKTVDDGTLWNFGDGSFRMTSAEPNLKWIQDAGMGLDAEVSDVSEEIGALALQGPSSRA